MKVSVKVTYDGPLDLELDKKIREAMKSIGGVWWAQGYDLTSDVRDICFDVEL